MFKTILNYIRIHKIISSFFVVIFGLVIFFILNSGSNSIETLVVEIGIVSEEVIVTGKVKPANEVSLAFDKTGKISRTSTEVGREVYVGQILASIDSLELQADLLKAQANLKTEEAKLDELNRGVRTEEIAISESEVFTSQVSVSNAEERLRASLHEAYSKSDDVVRNTIDQFFSNSRSSNPQINIPVYDTQLKNDINSLRFNIENLLLVWDKNPISTSRDVVIKVSADLNTVKMFVDKASTVVNSLTQNSSLSQSTIEGYKSSVSSARNSLISAQSSISNSEEKLNSAKSSLLLAQKNLTLKKAGSSVEEIRAQEARILQQNAQLQAVSAQLSKTVLRSPIVGIVTKQDAKVGEIVTAGTPIISVISNNNLEIEANVSEVSIGKVQVGNRVSITMDAFSDKTFEGTVSYIEPGETIVDGVVNFKITVSFDKKYGELKTGLSSNLVIITNQKIDVLKIPVYSIIEKNNRQYVNKKTKNNGIVEVEIETGFRGSDGFIEVVSGLKEGDVVVITNKVE